MTVKEKQERPERKAPAAVFAIAVTAVLLVLAANQPACRAKPDSPFDSTTASPASVDSPHAHGPPGPGGNVERREWLAAVFLRHESLDTYSALEQLRDSDHEPLEELFRHATLLDKVDLSSALARIAKPAAVDLLRDEILENQRGKTLTVKELSALCWVLNEIGNLAGKQPKALSFLIEASQPGYWTTNLNWAFFESTPYWTNRWISQCFSALGRSGKPEAKVRLLEIAASSSEFMEAKPEVLDGIVEGAFHWDHAGLPHPDDDRSFSIWIKGSGKDWGIWRAHMGEGKRVPPPPW